MSSILPNSDDGARKIQSVILRRLASVGQSALAQALNTSESSVSRMKDNQIPEMALILAKLGLKVVPESARCYSPKYIAALQTLAGMELTGEEATLDEDFE